MIPSYEEGKRHVLIRCGEVTERKTSELFKIELVACLRRELPMAEHFHCKYK